LREVVINVERLADLLRSHALDHVTICPKVRSSNPLMFR
jgi:hypothetical protein